MNKYSLPAVQAPHMIDFISHSAAQTARIGQRLGENLCAGDVLLLYGTLGVGKTQLIKGIVQGLGSDDMVTSPSFVLINEYRAGSSSAVQHIYHADLYRMENPAELGAIGLEELWQGDTICLVEWAERGEGWLPRDNLAIYMAHLDETKRVLRLVPQGQRYLDLVETFKTTAFG